MPKGKRKVFIFNPCFLKPIKNNFDIEKLFTFWLVKKGSPLLYAFGIVIT